MQPLAKDFLQWWYAIYWVPLCLALVFLLLSAMSTGGDEGDGGGDGDGGADGTTDGSGDDGGDGDGDGDGDDGTDGAGHHILNALGIGRIPITLGLSLLMLFWGTFGLIANRIGQEMRTPHWVFVPPSMLVNLVVTLVVTRFVAGLYSKYMPGVETFAITDTDLIGCEGSAVYQVSETAGTVQVTDRYGTVHRRQARTEPGVKPLPSGTRVIVVGFDEGSTRLTVKRYDEDSLVGR
jgi:membrane protein implicated in regulation of membrane protease activity